MSLTSLAVVLATVERALAGLEAEAGWQPSDALAGMLVRRRHSVRLLRRAVSGPEAAAARISAMRTVTPSDVAALIWTEEHLAALLDGWIAAMKPDHGCYALAMHLRMETDDAARVLRMLQKPQT